MEDYKITLKIIRQKLGLTQIEMAVLMGMAMSQVSDKEREPHTVKHFQQFQAHLIAIDMLAEMGLVPELRRRIIASHVGYHGRLNGALSAKKPKPPKRQGTTPEPIPRYRYNL